MEGKAVVSSAPISIVMTPFLLHSSKWDFVCCGLDPDSRDSVTDAIYFFVVGPLILDRKTIGSELRESDRQCHFGDSRPGTRVLSHSQKNKMSGTAVSHSIYILEAKCPPCLE